MNTTINIMQSEVLTVKAETTMKEAYLIMRENDIRHLPVLDNHSKVIGILSERDIQRAMEVKIINDYAQEIRLPNELVVSQFMSWPVFTANASTPLKSIAKTMLKDKISAIVVESSEGKLVGILTTSDMLALLIDMLSEDPKEQSKSTLWPQWTLERYLALNKCST